MAKRRAEDSADEGPSRGGPRAAEMSPESRKDKFALHLKALNKQFSKWVSSQAESNSGELWRDGVKDYLKHADKLMEDFADVVKAEIASPSAPAAPAAAPAFGSSAFGSSSPIKFGASAGGGSSLFGQPPAPSSSSPAAPSSLFSFGGGAPAAPASTGGGLFSFQPSSAAAPPAAQNNGTDGDGDGEADDDDEPKRESSPSLKDDDTVEKQYDLLWSNKSKLFLQPEGETGWNDAGVGIFSIRRMKEGQGSSTPYMVFMSSSGKALLNASLYKGLTPTIGKNAKLVLMKLVVSGTDGTTSDKMVLVKFAKDEIAKECKDKVEEQSPK